MSSRSCDVFVASSHRELGDSSRVRAWCAALLRQRSHAERVASLWLAAAVVSCTVGCESDSARGAKRELSVLAASSLTESFRELEQAFEAQHPNVDVRLTFAGSQVLRLQIEQGASADVFASANAEHMQAVIDAGRAAAGHVFAHNELVIIVPRNNPARIKDLADLTRASNIVIGTTNVPVGRYTQQMLERASNDLGPEFAAEVRRRVVSEESNVRLVRAKVELGEADAAIVYRTDAAASERLRMIPIRREHNVTASYPIARLTDAPHPSEAERFVSYVLSSEGRGVLSRHGFVNDAQ